MKTNATKTAKIAEANTIELGRVEIHEPGEESQNVIVQLQIPFRFYLYGKRNLKEYKEIALEDLRIKATTFFQLTEFLSRQLAKGNGNAVDIAEFINLSGTIGQGLMEATEILEMDFERYSENEGKQVFETPKAESQASLISDNQTPAKTLEEHHLQIMANKINHVLASDKVSDEFKDALGDCLMDAGNEGGIGFSHPILAKTAFPLIIESLDSDYGKGIYHTIRTLIESVATDEIRDELIKYEKRFKPLPEDENPQVTENILANLKL
jgi:hypothetical protein